jgi:hypothetical protein
MSSSSEQGIEQGIDPGEEPATEAGQHKNRASVTAAERDRPGAEGGLAVRTAPEQQQRSGTVPEQQQGAIRVGGGPGADQIRGADRSRRSDLGGTAEAEDADSIEGGGWDTGRTGNPEDEADVMRPA